MTKHHNLQQAIANLIKNNQALRRENDALQARLNGRTIETIHLLEQVIALKAACAEHGLEVSFGTP